jgi:hypothetical protein
LLWNPASLIEGEWYSPRYSGLCVKHNEVGRDFIPNAIAAAMHNPQKVLLEALYLQEERLQIFSIIPVCDCHIRAWQFCNETVCKKICKPAPWPNQSLLAQFPMAAAVAQKLICSGGLETSTKSHELCTGDNIHIPGVQALQ